MLTQAINFKSETLSKLSGGVFVNKDKTSK